MSYSPAPMDDTPRSQTSHDTSKTPPLPSWFGKGIDEEQGAALADQYRSRREKTETSGQDEVEQLALYRRRLDDKFRQAQNRYETQTRGLPKQDNSPNQRMRRSMMPSAELQSRQRRFVNESPVARVQKRQKPWALYATLAIISILAGGGIGFSLANPTLMKSFATAGLDKTKAYLGSVAALPATGTLLPESKPIQTASLAVTDVRGTLNSQIPLALSAPAAMKDQPIAVQIEGLPPSAYLTAGEQAPSGRWVVKAPDFENVKLVIPQSNSSKINLEVAAIEERTGELASPAKSMSVELSDVQITPAAAHPESNQVAAVPMPLTSRTSVMEKADDLMKQGDIVSARQLYLQAAQLGDPKGAYGVGRTYDPKVFAELKIQGLLPDQTKADEWYGKAAAQGVAGVN